MTRWRLGIDIGGTFTDIVLAGPTGLAGVAKVPSTPDDYSRAIVAGITNLLHQHGVVPQELSEVVHGTTIATNAVLERRGARTGLITTVGFRDVLELRRIRAPVLYDMNWEKPPPLVRRRLRLEVEERIDHAGRVAVPLAASTAQQALETLAEFGAESIAVCLINAYVNQAHERQIAELASKILPDVPISLSSEVAPEIREYERTSTTVVNAYVRPLVERYLRALGYRLTALGVEAPLLVMQSNGGVMAAEQAARNPVHLLESGPAAGVIAAAHMARARGLERVISFDMGGTTAKASLVESGQVTFSREMEVGAPLSFASRLMKGGGYPVLTSMVDVAEVGAGAGSIAEVDEAAALRVSARSAGASPGPVCYALGGEEPTVTDANVVLGYLNPDNFGGGAMRLDVERARWALESKIADRLDREVEGIAYGIHLIAVASMVRAVKAVTTERGRDVRDSTLIVFGGSGPVHAGEIARAIGVCRLLIPPIAGVFSAAGLLLSDVEHHTVKTVIRTLSDLERVPIDGLIDEMCRDLTALLDSEGYDHAHVAIEGYADARYHGQSDYLSVPVFANGPRHFDAAAVRNRFAAEYQRTYGHRDEDGEIELVNLRLVGRGLAERPPLFAAAVTRPAASSRRSKRSAYFGAEAGWIQTPIYGRDDVGATRIAGPLIVEEYDTTVVVPPGAGLWRDASNNLLVEVGP